MEGNAVSSRHLYYMKLVHIVVNYTNFQTQTRRIYDKKTDY